MNKKGITRKIYALILSLLCLISAVTVYAEDNQEEQTVNPFNVSATEPDYEGKFTLNINISKNCVVEAFKISVEYDDAMVSVSQDTSAYGNYSSFWKNIIQMVGESALIIIFMTAEKLFLQEHSPMKVRQL